MNRGYIRVSTKSQKKGTSLADQRESLIKAGCTEFYTDVFTGSTMERPEFQRMCSEVQPGDTITFTKIDRVARTETEAYELVLAWVKAGVNVHILNLGLIEDTPTGRLMLHVMLAFAEFERDMINERMQTGRAYKRETDPLYKEGRPRKFSKAQMDHVIDLLHDHSYTEVSRMTGIPKTSITREAARRGFRKSALQTST